MTGDGLPTDCGGESLKEEKAKRAIGPAATPNQWQRVRIPRESKALKAAYRPTREAS